MVKLKRYEQIILVHFDVSTILYYFIVVYQETYDTLSFFTAIVHLQQCRLILAIYDFVFILLYFSSFTRKNY